MQNINLFLSCQFISINYNTFYEIVVSSLFEVVARILLKLVQDLQRFKYALTANRLYATLKDNYYKLLDLYDRSLSAADASGRAELQQLMGWPIQGIFPYAQMNQMIASLRVQLNETKQQHKADKSQLKERRRRVDELKSQLEVQKLKFFISESKCEAKQRQLEQLQRENYDISKSLVQEVQRLGRLNSTQNESIAQLIQENTVLFRENQSMKEQLHKQQRRTPKIEFIRSEIPQLQCWQSFKQSAVTDCESEKQNHPFN